MQVESVTMDEKKNKMKENEQKGNLEKFRRKTLDFNKIEKFLPGLQNYKEPNEESIKEYLKSSNPLSYENNIWILMFFLAIFVLTLVSL